MDIVEEVVETVATNLEVALTKVEAVLDGLDQDIAMVNMLNT